MKVEFDASRRDRDKLVSEGKEYRVIVETEIDAVPRIGERVWCNLLDEIEEEIHDSEWRVTDVWWLLSGDDEPDCVVFVELMNVDENGIES